MKPLHRTIVERSRARIGEFAPSPASAEQLAAAEQRLGKLPAAYRDFLAEIGRAPWPLRIGNVVDHEFSRAPQLPEWFVPFAADLSGNYYGFDVHGRPGKTPRIEYWDGEAEAIDDAPGEVGNFGAWLSDQVRCGLAREHAERRQRIFAALVPHYTGAFTPSAREAVAAGRALGVELPGDYVEFTVTAGSLLSPVQIVDALDLAGLTDTLRRAHPDAPRPLAAFARDGARGFVAFTRAGELQYFGGAAGPSAFLDYLETLLARRPAPTVARPPVARRANRSRPDPTERLRTALETMKAEKMLETTADFSPSAVAAELAGVPLNGASITAALLERDDVLEVYATDADIDALL